MPSVLKVNEVQSDTDLPLVFNVGNSERGRIDTSGNLGLGTSSPRSLLNPRGSGSIGAVLTLENSSTSVGSGEALGSIEFYSNDTSTGGTGIKGKIASVDDTGFGQNYALTFSTGYVTGGATALTERARFNSSGAFVFAGGTTTADGIGITFPASQSASTNANTLDDYEEGTFTATLSPGTSGSITLNSIYDLLSYTKIGRLVTITGQLVVSSVSSPVGSLLNLNNLPFPCADTSELSERAGGCTTYIDDSANLFYTQGMLLAASDTFTRIYMSESGRVAAIAANDAFVFSFSYITST